MVVTGHTKDSISIFHSDSQITPFTSFEPKGSAFARFHPRLNVPVSDTSMPPDLTNTLPRCPPNSVALSGEIVLRLVGGEDNTIGAGEFIVQRGCKYEWLNRMDWVCRIVVVMVGGEKAVLEDGTLLGETVFKK